MAHNKGDAEKRTLNPRADKSGEELSKEARHQEEGADRGDVVDSDAGIDGILEKGRGGYGADDSRVSERRDAPPLKDNG
jgi:hypothetical protein